ncbi:hypothetical protein C9374_003283 [Naegleria lovaniensis]|uniref:Vesicle-fusing ATPase n=1 Tax=Naegleria lovaniensis TaxID=51637 RepID=A0AA88GSY9_NAELO|nr:uncharacterized protein C9374_003283 [Naegleria lovaniensis]KAG2385468.1 hypothetical protein C9374_003283 [Naegleria lovaniensis]
MNDFVQRGKEIIGEAIALDRAKKYEQALEKYALGVKHFLTGLKYIKGERTKETTRGYAKQYLERAEQIKKLLKQQEQHSSNAQTSQSSPQKENVKTNIVNSSKTTKSSTPPKVKKPSPRKHLYSKPVLPNSAKKRTIDQASQQKSEQQELEASIKNSIVREKPNISWDEIVGMDGPKTIVNEAIILPKRFPQLFTEERKPIRTILLYGPPGTGKSMFVKCAASNIDATFFSVSSSDIVSKFMGESEKLVKTLFEEAKKSQPAVVFIDEIDAVGSSRDGFSGSSSSSSESMNRLKTELLLKMQEILDMDNHSDGVVVIAATNRPFDLDPALRRRFQKRIYIPLPAENERKSLFRINLEGVESDVTLQDLEQFAKATSNYSGSDISVVVRDALMKPLREAMKSEYFRWTKEGTIEPCSATDVGAKKMNLLDIQETEKLRIAKVTAQDVFDSIASIKPSTNPNELSHFVKFTQDYGESDFDLSNDTDNSATPSAATPSSSSLMDRTSTKRRKQDDDDDIE